MANEKVQNKIKRLLDPKLYSSEKSYYLTEYASSHYFLILDRECPLGVAQYYVDLNKKVHYHNFIPIQGTASPRLINALASVEELIRKEEE